MIETDKEKLTDEEIIEIVTQFEEDGISDSANLFDRMKKADDFRNGIQWDPAVKEANEALGKFCLTIPLIKPNIKQIVGTQIQNPKDVKVRNVRAGSGTIANILTALAKHAMDSEHVRFEQSLWFEAGFGNGAGYLGFFIDKSEDPKHGNLTIEKLNEFEVIVDPNCKVYDPNSTENGAKYMIWKPWVDKDLIHKQYPDKKEELEGSSEGGVLATTAAFISWLVGSATRAVSNFLGIEREDTETLTKYKYQKCHTFWRRPKKCVMWYDKRQSELDARLIVKSSEIQKVREAEKKYPKIFSVEDVVVNIMCHTVRVGDTLLEHNEDELNGVRMFPIVPYYSNFDNGFKSGMAEDMIGTQEEINWSHSMSLNIVKKLANTGYLVDKLTPESKAWLQTHGGTDGVIINKKDYGNIEKIEPSELPTAFHVITEQAKENLKMISNIRTEDPNFDTKNMSGRAIALKQQSSLTGSASTFANFDYSMSISGNLLIEIIRNNQIYSEDEIREIVSEEELIDRDLMNQARELVIQEIKQSGIEIPEPPEQPDVAYIQQAEPEAQQAFLAEYQEEIQLYTEMQQKIDQMAKPIAQQLLLDEIKNMKKGKYNTKVTLSPYAPTLRMAKAAELFELNKTLQENQQMPIGRKQLIEATDVDNQEEIIEEGERQMAQMAGAGK